MATSVQDFHLCAQTQSLKDREMTLHGVPAVEDCRYKLEDLQLLSHGMKSQDTSSQSEVTTRLAALESENKVIKQKLKESLQTKSKWQAYDRSRDDIINRLEMEKRKLQAQLSQVRPSDIMSTERDDVILYWKRKAEEEESLRKHLEEVKRGHEVLIQNLQMALQQSQTNSADQERMEILENQVKIFSDDFEQERRDRERAQACVLDLEDRLRLAEMQLSQFQDSTMSRMATQRRHTMNSYRAEYNRQVALQSPSTTTSTSSRLIPHGLYHYPSPDLDGEDSEGEDCVGDLPMAHGFVDSRNAKNKVDALECPKCQKQFPVSDPMSFLEHNDICS